MLQNKQIFGLVPFCYGQFMDIMLPNERLPFLVERIGVCAPAEYVKKYVDFDDDFVGDIYFSK